MKCGLLSRLLCALLCAAILLGSMAVAGADTYSELRYGMRDDEGVRQMQRRLIELGYLSSTATGGYWDGTKNAVARFQGDNGLQINGNVASAEMLALLFDGVASQSYSDPAASGETGSSQNVGNWSELRYGTEGSDAVSQMQRRLIALGYLSGSPTGGYWDKTRDAVAAFQAAAGLPINGKVASEEMLAALFSGSAMQNNVQPAVTRKPPEVTPTPAATAKQPEVTPTPTPDMGAETVLRYGMQGSDAVSQMQDRLRSLGYFDSRSSGGYWEKTKDAVAAFLAAAGLSGDGKTASAAMLALLYSADAPYAEGAATPPPETVTPAPTATPEPTPVVYSELRAYSQSEAVKAMQERLKALGFFSGNATSGYYSVTISAVEQFQKAAGLPVNGKVVTVEMQQRLFAADAPNAYDMRAEYVTLTYGMENSDQVRLMQRRLAALGYFSDTASGSYYSSTSRAVAAFQEAIWFPLDGRTATGEMLAILYSNDAPVYGTKLGEAPTPTPEPTVTPTPEPTLEPSPTPTVNYEQLVFGMAKNDAVYALQQRLHELGYLSCNATGNYYTMTVSALKAFLQHACMVGDGYIATNEMQQLLFADNMEAQIAARRTALSEQLSEYAAASTDIYVYPGNSGDQVLLLTKRLIQLGYLSGEPTDSYTNVVTQAVKWFQNSNGLQVDGVAGPQTLGTLYSMDVFDAEESQTGRPGETVSATDGTVRKPSIGTIRNIDFFSTAGDKYFNRKSGVFCDGATATITDVATGISYTVKRRGGYNHADVEPVTSFDTWQMYRIYGGEWSWARRSVIVTLSDGTSLAASINGMPHGSASISNNNMDGHTCIHFLNSRTHSSDKVDPAHQAAVAAAAATSASTVQGRVNAQ